MTLNPAYSWIGGSCERLLDVCPYLRTVSLTLSQKSGTFGRLLDVRHCHRASFRFQHIGSTLYLTLILAYLRVGRICERLLDVRG